MSCNGAPKKGKSNAKEKDIKHDIELHYLHVHKRKPIGILRLECKDCIITYHINNKDSVIKVKNGNQDRFLYPKSKDIIKTELYSCVDQMIRVLLIDPNGNIIYNELNHFKKGELSQNKYLMQYTKKSNTIIVKQQIEKKG